MNRSLSALAAVPECCGFFAERIAAVYALEGKILQRNRHSHG
jgi:hypothetical protein